MTVHRHVLGAFVLLLAACGVLPDRPAKVILYDFGPGVLHAGAAEAAMPRLPPLALAPIDASPRLDGTQLLYRLGYANPQELRAYGQSRWSLSPAQLLRQRLGEALSARRVVLDPQQGASLARASGPVPLMLYLRLDEFTHYFETPERSIGLVRAHATLTQRESGGERILAQRAFAVPRPATTPDAPGAVKALTEASDALVAQVVQWVEQPR